LVVHWSELVDESTGYDPVVREKIIAAFKNEPLLQAGSHLSAEVRDYIHRAYRATGAGLS
jgi:hypothetical protein